MLSSFMPFMPSEGLLPFSLFKVSGVSPANSLALGFEGDHAEL